MLSGEVQRSTTCQVLTAAIMSIRQFCKPREHERIENLESGPCSKRPRLDDSSGSSSENESSSGLASTAPESSSTDSSTKSKRKQASKFCTEWMKGRQHWLKYIPGQGMICTLCQKHNKSPGTHTTWNTTPCNRLR